MPADCRTSVPGRIVLRNDREQGEGVGEVERAELARCKLGMEQLAALDRALEAAVWCPLRRHRRSAAGATTYPDPTRSAHQAAGVWTCCRSRSLGASTPW